MNKQKGTAPLAGGAVDTKGIKGPEGVPGMLDPDAHLQTDFGSEEDQHALMAEIQQSMRQELGLM